MHGDGITLDNNLRGKPAWNSGLTKETDPRIKKAADTFNNRILIGEIKPFFLGKSLSTEHRQKISKTISNNVKTGNWHLSFSKSRTFEYKGNSFHGLWEIEYAKWLDKKSIKWRRPSEKFEYTFDGKRRYYIPDFYLIDDKKYIEIKGYPTNKDFAKWNQFPLDLEILNGKDLFSLRIISSYKKVNKEYKGKSWNT